MNYLPPFACTWTTAANDGRYRLSRSIERASARLCPESRVHEQSNDSRVVCLFPIADRLTCSPTDGSTIVNASTSSQHPNACRLIRNCTSVVSGSNKQLVDLSSWPQVQLAGFRAVSSLQVSCSSLGQSPSLRSGHRYHLTGT